MIKNYQQMAFVMAAIFAGSGSALANDLYMEQIGDNSVISVSQTGAGNLINGDIGGVDSEAPALIQGDNNTVTISQIGASNVLRLSINNATNGTGATVNISADGSGNTQTVSCGSSLSSNCNASQIVSEVTGNNNNTTQTLSGGTLRSKIEVTGNYNTVTHVASGAGLHVGEIIVTGSGTSSVANAVTLTQSGATTKNAIITSNGSNNNIAITQSD